VAPKSVVAKAGLKAGSSIAVVNRAPGIVEELGLPPDVTFVDLPEAQIVFLFVNTRAELESRMPEVVSGLAEKAVIWVFFRKGSKAAGLDMNRDTVWSVAERLNLRPIGLVSVDETWSVFRLRP
jgi:hypothetical protein